MEIAKKLFKAFLVVSVITLFWGTWFQFKGGDWDKLFSNQRKAYLTDVSLSCLSNSCHGTSESKKVVIKTPWGTQTWTSNETVYIDPHTKVEKLKSSFIREAYATVYDGIGNHPVGVPYPMANPEYIYPISYPVFIPNGYVQCESCHVVEKPRANSHGALVMSNDRSQLCLSCHKK